MANSVIIDLSDPLMNTAISHWLEAARPKTLPLAIISVLIAASLAFTHGVFSLPITLLALATAIGLQVLANFANDYGDGVKGTDSADRIGPKRAIQTGVISLTQMKVAIVLTSLVCAGFGVWLLFVSLDSWWAVAIFALIGLCAIMAAITYTVGRNSYGYSGFGDLFVFLFFGLAAVLGGFFLQAQSVTLLLFLPAIGAGLFSVAVLNMNNLRDIDSDIIANKRTIPTRIGFRAAKGYQVLLILVAHTCFSLYLFFSAGLIWALIYAALGLVESIISLWSMIRAKEALAIVPLFGQTAKRVQLAQLFFCLLLVVQTLWRLFF